MEKNEIINDCNAEEKDDLISRKAVLEEIKLYEKELEEDREIAIESEDEHMLFAIANQNTTLHRIRKNVFHMPAASISEPVKKEPVKLKDLLLYVSYGTALDIVEQDNERGFVFNNHLFPQSDLITREVIERHYPELLEREVTNGIHAEGMRPDTIVVPIKKK